MTPGVPKAAAAYLAGYKPWGPLRGCFSSCGIRRQINKVTSFSTATTHCHDLWLTEVQQKLEEMCHLKQFWGSLLIRNPAQLWQITEEKGRYLLWSCGFVVSWGMAALLLLIFNWGLRIKVCSQEKMLLWWVAHPGCCWGEAWAPQESLQSDLCGGDHWCPSKCNIRNNMLRLAPLGKVQINRHRKKKQFIFQSCFNKLTNVFV